MNRLSRLLLAFALVSLTLFATGCTLTDLPECTSNDSFVTCDSSPSGTLGGGALNYGMTVDTLYTEFYADGEITAGIAPFVKFNAGDVSDLPGAQGYITNIAAESGLNGKAAGLYLPNGEADSVPNILLARVPATWNFTTWFDDAVRFDITPKTSICNGQGSFKTRDVVGTPPIPVSLTCNIISASSSPSAIQHYAAEFAGATTPQVEATLGLVPVYRFNKPSGQYTLSDIEYSTNEWAFTNGNTDPYYAYSVGGYYLQSQPFSTYPQGSTGVVQLLGVSSGSSFCPVQYVTDAYTYNYYLYVGWHPVPSIGYVADPNLPQPTGSIPLYSVYGYDGSYSLSSTPIMDDYGNVGYDDYGDYSYFLGYVVPTNSYGF